MRWNYHPKSRPEWSRWFAWRFVFIGPLPPEDGQKRVWLEWVERKYIGSYDGMNSYEYRLPGMQSEDLHTENAKRTFDSTINLPTPPRSFREICITAAEKLGKPNSLLEAEDIQKALDRVKESRVVGERMRP